MKDGQKKQMENTKYKYTLSIVNLNKYLIKKVVMHLNFDEILNFIFFGDEMPAIIK